jgi:hypothetical protein
MMPKRRRIRAQHLARRINAERKLNDAYVAERSRPPALLSLFGRLVLGPFSGLRRRSGCC